MSAWTMIDVQVLPPIEEAEPGCRIYVTPDGQWWLAEQTGWKKIEDALDEYNER
jgi:hypothetical protein